MADPVGEPARPVGRTYRRVRLVGPGQAVVEPAPVTAPGPGRLLIAPAAVGLCGTDLELLDGTMAYLSTGQSAYPMTPGHEWAGTVVAVGPGVSGFAAGDRVVGEAPVGCGTCGLCRSGRYHLCPDRIETGFIRQDGALAELLDYPAAGAHRIPDPIGFADAALIEPTAVAFRGVQRLLDGARLDGDGGRVLVVGGGTIGLLAAMAAAALGVPEVVVVEPDQGRRRFAASLDLPVAPEVVGSWPLVVEASGNAAGMRAALAAAGVDGRVLLVGLCGQPTVPVDLDRVVLSDQTVLGSLSSPGVWPQVIDLVATGALAPGRLVTRTFPLDQVGEAFAHLAERRPGKVHVLPQA